MVQNGLDVEADFAGGCDRLWIETAIQKAPLPSQLIYLVVGFIVYSLYLFFNKMIGISELNISSKIIIASMSIMIPYMLWLIQYLLNTMRKISLYWDELFSDLENHTYIGDMSRLTQSYWYYILIFSIIVPFYLMDWIAPNEQKFVGFNYTLSFFEQFIKLYFPIYSLPGYHTTWAILYDIYTQILGFLALLFLSIILWIMLNISWILSDRSRANRNDLLNSCVYMQMKMLIIKNEILNILLLYFICISLAIISYFNPTVFFSKETYLLLMLLLIGIFFFFFGLTAMQNILKERVIYELNEINKKEQEQRQRFRSAIASSIKGENDEVNSISKIFDVLWKQREQLMQLKTNLYDNRSNIKFIFSILLPFLSSLFKDELDNGLANIAGISHELASEMSEAIIMLFNKL